MDGLDWNVILGPEGRHMLASGLMITLQLSVYGIVLSTLAGLLIAMGRVTSAPALAPLRWFLSALTEVCRNIPLLVHLAVWHFGVFGFAAVHAFPEPLAAFYSTHFLASQIGRASCVESVCQYG